MKTVFLVVQTVSVPGHGESYDFTALCTTDVWGVQTCPAYTTRKEVERQRQILGGGNRKVLEIPVMDRL